MNSINNFKEKTTGKGEKWYLLRPDREDAANEVE